MKKYTIFITIITAIILLIIYLAVNKLKKTEKINDQSIMVLQDKAHDLAKEGKLKEAENVYLEAISHAKQLYGKKYCLAGTPAYVRLSTLYLKQGRYDDAIAQLKAAIKSYEKSVANAVSPTNLFQLKVLLAAAYKNKQDYKNAEKQYLDVTPHIDKLPLYAQYDYYSKYGDVCYSLRQYKKALLLLKKALHLVEKQHGLIEVNSLISNVYPTLGNTYLKLRKDDKALSIFNKSLNIAIEKYGKNSEEVAESYFWFGRAYLLTKKLNQSKKSFHKSIVVSKKCQSEMPIAVMAYLNLADIANVYDKDKIQALEFLQKAHKVNSQLSHPIEKHKHSIKAEIKRIKLELQTSQAMPTLHK